MQPDLNDEDLINRDAQPSLLQRKRDLLLDIHLPQLSNSRFRPAARVQGRAGKLTVDAWVRRAKVSWRATHAKTRFRPGAAAGDGQLPGM